MQVGWPVDVASSREIEHIALPVVEGADVILLAVADGAIAEVAARLAEHAPSIGGVVAHVSGARTLDVLAPHPRRASIHPLMSLPSAEIGSARLLDSCTFAVDGDSAVDEMVEALGGRAIRVPGEERATYHAAASVAANHLTALCDQVERLADAAGVPADAYWPLMATTLENVTRVGSAEALTGPAARGDWDTVRAHLNALADDERLLYRVLCQRAGTMAGHAVPDDVRVS